MAPSRKFTHRRVDVTVCGSGVFPFDMLRYDQCAPRTLSDTAAMKEPNFRVVNLHAYSDRSVERIKGPESAVTMASWESYGWFVLTTDELAAYHSNLSINAVLDLHAVIQGRLTAAGDFPRRGPGDL